MSDLEYIQDEKDTIDLVVWEEWVSLINDRGLSQPKNEDRSCTDSQHDSP